MYIIERVGVGTFSAWQKLIWSTGILYIIYRLSFAVNQKLNMLIYILIGFSSDHIRLDDNHFLITHLYETHPSTEFYSSVSILLTPNTKILTPVQCLHVTAFSLRAENSPFAKWPKESY